MCHPINVIHDDVIKTFEKSNKLPRDLPTLLQIVEARIKEGLNENYNMEITLTWNKGASPSLVTKYKSISSGFILPEDLCYYDTDSVKTEGPYRGGFTHTNFVKEDPDGT